MKQNKHQIVTFIFGAIKPRKNIEMISDTMVHPIVGEADDKVLSKCCKHHMQVLKARHKGDSLTTYGMTVFCPKDRVVYVDYKDLDVRILGEKKVTLKPSNN